MSTISEREAKREAAERSHEERVTRSMAAVTTALEAAGWRVTQPDSFTFRHLLRVSRLDAPEMHEAHETRIDVGWTFIAAPHTFRYGTKTGDERLSVLVGDRFGGPTAIKIQATKEDRDLVGARVAKIVEAVDAYAGQLRARDDEQRRVRAIGEASKKIASACNAKMVGHGVGVGSFIQVGDKPDVVQFTANTRLQKADAEKLAALLATFKRSPA